MPGLPGKYRGDVWLAEHLEKLGSGRTELEIYGLLHGCIAASFRSNPDTDSCGSQTLFQPSTALFPRFHLLNTAGRWLWPPVMAARWLAFPKPFAHQWPLAYIYMEIPSNANRREG